MGDLGDLGDYGWTHKRANYNGSRLTAGKNEVMVRDWDGHERVYRAPEDRADFAAWARERWLEQSSAALVTSQWDGDVLVLEAHGKG